MNPTPYLDCDTCGGLVGPDDGGMCRACRDRLNVETLNNDLDERTSPRAVFRPETESADDAGFSQ